MDLPEKIEINTDDLTVGDLETLEEMLDGQAFGEALKDLDNMRAKTLTAFVFVVLRHDFPDVTVEDVRGIKLSVLNSDEDEEPAAEPDPTPPAV